MSNKIRPLRNKIDNNNTTSQAKMIKVKTPLVMTQNITKEDQNDTYYTMLSPYTIQSITFTLPTHLTIKPSKPQQDNNLRTP